jgi:hypothetical protein
MGKTDAEKTKEYRKQTSLELINNYKDLIEKTFTVTDKDLLQDKLNSESDKETEQKFLDAIKRRRVALDEIDLMLDKIEKLEISINAIDGKVDEENSETNPNNKHIRKE